MTTLYRILNSCYFLLLAGFCLLASCKKEYETAPTPYNEITSFKIAYLDGQDTLRAIIDGETIHIVWPATLDWPVPETVHPEIKISPDASVSPASGEAISLSSGTTYTVTAADGSVRTYTLQLTSSALLPAFVNEDAIQAVVGGTYNIPLYSLVGDGSDSLFLIDADQKEYKPLPTQRIAVGGISFIADQEDGTGIPAGEYYVKVINKYGVPVVSSQPMITVTDAPPMAYPYLTNSAAIEMKPGETFTIPVRHYEGYEINRVRFYYDDPETGYPAFINAEYVGTNETFSEVTIRLPQDAPTGVSSRLEDGIQIRYRYDGRNNTVAAPYHPYPITIVE